jgi:hypothetical protein
LDIPGGPVPGPGAEGIIAEMTAGLGTVAMLGGRGHYPHLDCPEQAATLITNFFRERVLA